MKNLAKIGLLVLVPVMAFALVAVFNSAPVSAHGDEDHSKDEKKGNRSKSSGLYTYTAQDGDSYSLMARKSVQHYSKDNKSNLNQAQIIFAETSLTQAAGSPQLEIGQKVTIKESDVKTVVEKAKKLTPAEQSAWAQYAAGANFDTTHVGVAE